MDSTGKVEALQRDANALKRDVDRRLDSLRGETDRQLRDGERRVSSLERSRDTAQNLFWFSIPLVTAVAMIIILVIAVIVSREQRREPGEPGQGSPSSINAPLAGFGGPLPPGLVAAGTPFRGHPTARTTMAEGPGTTFFHPLGIDHGNRPATSPETHPPIHGKHRQRNEPMHRSLRNRIRYSCRVLTGNRDPRRSTTQGPQRGHPVHPGTPQRQQVRRPTPTHHLASGQPARWQGSVAVQRPGLYRGRNSVRPSSMKQAKPSCETRREVRLPSPFKTGVPPGTPGRPGTAPGRNAT